MSNLPKTVNPGDLVGPQRMGFYGVDNNVFCLTVGRHRRAFEVVEDDNDGYRSTMKELRDVPLVGNIFFKRPIAMVAVRESHLDRGWELVDEEGWVWLLFGTDYSVEYYPLFIFRYMPKGAPR